MLQHFQLLLEWFSWSARTEQGERAWFEQLMGKTWCPVINTGHSLESQDTAGRMRPRSKSEEMAVG